MSQAINNTLIELLVKMFATLLVVIGLLAVSVSAEAYSFDNMSQHNQTERLEGQLRSSIAFERAFDKERIFLAVKGNTIYLTGELTDAKQRENILSFIQALAPAHLVEDNTQVKARAVPTKHKNVARLINWMSRSTD